VSFQRNRVSPYRSPQGEGPSRDESDGDAGNGKGSKRRLPCNRADRGCVALGRQHHLAGNGAHFLLVLNSRTLEEPMYDAKQMTTGQPVGAASHTTGDSTAVRIGSKSVSSRSASPLFEPGRVLVVQGDVFGCSSRMNGKPSRPVLRGLGARNGARLLDSSPRTRFVRWSGGQRPFIWRRVIGN
jgi:hypothetical protein